MRGREKYNWELRYWDIVNCLCLKKVYSDLTLILYSHVFSWLSVRWMLTYFPEEVYSFPGKVYFVRIKFTFCGEKFTLYWKTWPWKTLGGCHAAGGRQPPRATMGYSTCASAYLSPHAPLKELCIQCFHAGVSCCKNQ